MILAKKQGFTLVEILVAIGIFAIVSVIVSSVFLRLNNLQRNIANNQRLQNESRYIVEKIAKEIRGREINLPDPGSNPTSTIKFYTEEGGDNTESEELIISRQGVDLQYSLNGEIANLNSTSTEVETADFYIFPTSKDVWDPNPSVNLQPRVTVLLKLKNKDQAAEFTKEVVVQTTISSRIYKR